jgi:hypothetical protein
VAALRCKAIISIEVGDETAQHGNWTPIDQTAGIPVDAALLSSSIDANQLIFGLQRDIQYSTFAKRRMCGHSCAFEPPAESSSSFRAKLEHRTARRFDSL